MTTIAYKEGVLASDSGAFDDQRNLYLGFTPKVYTLSGGLLYGAAGDIDDRAVRNLLDAVRSPDQLPSTRELLETKCDVEAIVVFPDGKLFTIMVAKADEDKPDSDWVAEVAEIRTPYIALGSGRQIALGAMWAGLTATKAIEAAMEHNVWTRGPVQSLKVKPLELKR